VAVLLLLGQSSMASSVLLETFTPAQSVYTSGGWILQGGGGHLGVRFTVASTTHLDSVVANLGGSGRYFVGLEAIPAGAGVPSTPREINPDDLLFYTTQSFPALISRDTRTTIGRTLEPGRYLIYFGGLGPIFESDSGWMPPATTLANSAIPLTEYFEYRGRWETFEAAGIRVVLEGTVVPLPATLPLMLTAGLLIAWRGSRRVRTSPATW
jgi:hypothetical protein